MGTTTAQLLAVRSAVGFGISVCRPATDAIVVCATHIAQDLPNDGCERARRLCTPASVHHKCSTNAHTQPAETNALALCVSCIRCVPTSTTCRSALHCNRTPTAAAEHLAWPAAARSGHALTRQEITASRRPERSLLRSRVKLSTPHRITMLCAMLVCICVYLRACVCVCLFMFANALCTFGVYILLLDLSHPAQSPLRMFVGHENIKVHNLIRPVFD